MHYFQNKRLEKVPRTLEGLAMLLFEIDKGPWDQYSDLGLSRRSVAETSLSQATAPYSFDTCGFLAAPGLQCQISNQS